MKKTHPKVAEQQSKAQQEEESHKKEELELSQKKAEKEEQLNEESEKKAMLNMSSCPEQLAYSSVSGLTQPFLEHVPLYIRDIRSM